ncbi:MAG: glycosyltransferase family 2 protein [Chitinophagaceae bacterium]|nr:glycosyltransferase family 2 protein [Chitinophagaceae bacterium]
MQLSIIIVNYNVKYFLEQCLSSVFKAINNLNAEVWVVDNASTDGSIEFLQARFSWINVIANEKNVGFAKANNQALYKCTGEYILFLNPDTIVAEDCFVKSLAFINEHPKAGALGIRMVDGQGCFLPESKRSFPSPVTSFFKLVGLTSLFPASRFFARYTLGYLDQHKNHEVDVLAGAFLMAKRQLLLSLHGFDEIFFMYGEDVDLSYRIQKQGYKNYYFSGSTIVHFKGESTKKGSLNYVRMFYQAMSIFVKKHYGSGKASIFSFFIQLAIWLRAGLSALSGVFSKVGLQVVDAGLVFASFHFINALWVDWFRSGEPYNAELVNIAFPGFTLLFILTALLAGMYDKVYKLSRAFSGASIATIILLASYSLLPEKYRFSRGVVLFGGITATLLIVLFRWLLIQWKVVDDTDESTKHQQTLVVGTQAEFANVTRLLTRIGLQQRIMGRVAANGNKEDAIAAVGQLPTLLESLRLREIIFCEGFLSFKAIIDLIQHLPTHINSRFHAQYSQSIVGSDSKDTSGEFVAVDGSFELGLPYQRRRKRMVDLAVALAILITFPVHFILNGLSIVRNALLVISGKKTWIGYSQSTNGLPRLRKGVLATNGFPVNDSSPLKKESLAKIDEWYARNYHWLQDVKMVARHYKKLG